MVDLPSVPDSIPQIRAPQSRISGSDVAQPFRELADSFSRQSQAAERIGQADVQKGNAYAGAMSTASDVLDKDIARPAARAAAATAVTRDANGEIQVAPSPLLVGPAADVYHQVVQQNYATMADQKASDDVAAARLKYEGSPEEFANWGNGYVSKVAENAPTPELANVARTVATRHVSETYNGIALREHARTVDSALKGIDNQQTTLENEMGAMVRGGAPMDSPSFQGRLAQYDQLQQQRTSNPVYGYSKDQAGFDRSQFLSRMTGDSIIHSVNTVYDDKSVDADGNANGGYRKALDVAENILTDPKLNMSQAQREQYYHLAMGEIRANEALRRQDVGEARSAFQELSLASATGMRIEPDQVEKVAQAARSAGDPGLSSRVYATFARKPLNDDFGRLPAAERAQGINAIVGANATKDATQFFIDKGYSRAAAAGIAGNLAHESGVDPTAVGDSGTSVGLAQFHNERATALRAYAASVGKPATDFRTQLEFIDKELHSTEGATLTKLNAAATPEEAAAAFVNYERPKGYDPNNPATSAGYASRVAFSRAIFNGGAEAAVAGGPAGAAWLAANRQRESDKSSWNEWSTIMKDYQENKTEPPVGRVNGIVAAARASGNAELLEQVGSDMSRIGAAREISQLPLSQQHAVMSQFEAQGRAGNLTPGHAALLKDLQQRDTAITKGLSDNPVATTVANFSGRFDQPPPLDPSNPDAFQAGLQARAKIAGFGAQNWGTPALSALDDADVTALRATLDKADPATKAMLYSGITSGITDEKTRNATLAKMGSKSPDAMAEAYAGGLYRQAPDIAASIFRGQTAMKVDDRLNPTNDKSFGDELDKVLPQGAFSLAGRTDPQGPYATMRGAITARYADLTAQDPNGKKDFSTARLKQATDDVTGGVLTHNGSNFIAPQRGMPQAQFDKVLWGVRDQDLAGVTSLAGQPITADYLRSTAQLESYGDGRYLVRLGSDPARPIYAVQGANTERPQPFVLDLRGRAPADRGPAVQGVEFRPYPRG